MSEGTPSGNGSRTRKVLVLRKAFDVYDTDRSGTIDYEELRKLLQDLGWPYDDAFVQRAVTILDTDNSGEVGFSEFLKWTEFAYTARILYRDELSSPLFAFRPKVEACEVQGAPLSPWLRRVLQENNQQLEKAMSGAGTTPLSTVLEEPECETVYEYPHHDADESQATEEDIDFLLPNSASSSPCHKSRHGNENRLTQKFSSRGLRANDLDFSAPITKMATMALGRNRDISRETTSRIRSKSVGYNQCFEDIPRGRERYRGDRKTSGPRVRSKATARMLWACEQLGTLMAYDSEEEEPNTLNDRKHKQELANMGRRKSECDQKREEVLTSQSRSSITRSRRVSCFGSFSRRLPGVSNQSNVIKDSEGDEDEHVRKTCSI